MPPRAAEVAPHRRVYKAAKMFELLLILVGGDAVRNRWWLLMALATLWFVTGAFFFLDALLSEHRIPPFLFAIPLLLDAFISFIAGIGGTGTHRKLRLAKAGVLVVIALLIFFRPWNSDIAIGFLVGAVLMTDAVWRATSALLVRFSRWRYSLAAAGAEFLLGLWSLVPWPTGWQGEVGVDVGTLMMVAGAGLYSLALKLRRMPPHMPVSRLFSGGLPPADTVFTERRALPPDSTGSLTVHVWTPTGTLVPLNRGIARYVAALDENGVISTGHAALEAGDDIYISHYPAVEIDRNQSEFTRTLRATHDNDVPGRFQPSYAIESAEWCPSTMRIEFTGIDIDALRRFWTAYRQDDTYNLTNRNCSSVVAKAIDASLEGVFADQANAPFFLFRLFWLPELWTAGLIRRRAAAMAWTPGMVLDYAHALSTLTRLPVQNRTSTLRHPAGS